MGLDTHMIAGSRACSISIRLTHSTITSQSSPHYAEALPRGMTGQITKGTPAPIQASRRWPVERTHAWGIQFTKLAWNTERRDRVIDAFLALAHAIITCAGWAAAPGRPTAGTPDRSDVHEPTNPRMLECVRSAGSSIGGRKHPLVRRQVTPWSLAQIDEPSAR
jgi:hypothetical protein